MRKFIRILVLGPIFICAFPIFCLVVYMFPSKNGFKGDMIGLYNLVIEGVPE